MAAEVEGKQNVFVPEEIDLVALAFGKDRIDRPDRSRPLCSRACPIQSRMAAEPSRPPSLWKKGLSSFMVLPSPERPRRPGRSGDVVVVGPVEFQIAAGQMGQNFRPVRPVKTPATQTAQAPVPQASVSPLPRSQTRIRTSSGESTSTNSALTRSGKCGSVSIRGPSPSTPSVGQLLDERDAMRIAHGNASDAMHLAV